MLTAWKRDPELAFLGEVSAVQEKHVAARRPYWSRVGGDEACSKELASCGVVGAD